MAHALTAPAELSFRRYGEDAPPHVHAFDQIVLPRRGVLEMEIDGKGGRVDPGRAAVVPPGARHAFAASGENLFVVADIGGDLMKPFERLRERPFAPVTGAVRGLLDFLSGEAPGAIESGVARLWTPLLLRGLSAAPTTVDPRLARAMGLIETRFDQPLTVRDLAAEAGMSQSRFFARFAEAYRTTPYAALVDARLRAAQRLLSDTHLSIAEIAARTGHGDQSALTKRMKATLGVTPGAWRRQR
ncbi:AraC family transcriptional regulator [Caulobacter segnis]|uniref:Transcriptional regulator, AraC family n=2 Tax=Caulobacter segnis TaxID=88688 RepID=D5VEY4_CAUST|nr:AraC family transcriptional regulator [Caulobacter segnis]ADG09402.1 transcriptional regulator, AraC family [Caulobacter segnis ATCC 21756]AVQ01202.1 AraC family transcriptional regulator [Caulobacter segnis]